MSYMVSTINLGSIKLNESDPVKSVLQNVAIILSTLRGSVPLYRDFGLPMTFLDRPMAAARPVLIAEIKDAISVYEPRANVTNVFLEGDPSGPGKLVATVEVEIYE